MTDVVALFCDPGGRVLRVLHDPFGVIDELVLGKPFTRLVDRSSLGKALSFLVELRTRGAAFDWDLPLMIRGRAAILHFAGFASQEGLFLVAGKDRAEVADVCRELRQGDDARMSVSPSPMKELASGKSVGDGFVYDDFSRLNNELVNLHREVARQNAELSRLNEQKNRFIGMAAHDLRSPLAAISGYSELLLDDLGDTLSDEHVEFLRIIGRSSEFMVQLVDDLLDVSTIESGKMDLFLVPTDLVELVRRNVALNMRLAHRKSITLESGPQVALPPLLVDPHKIEQVLNNLITNAIKFSHAGTCIHVGVTHSDDEALISVMDAGPGIPAAELDRLFRYFSTTSVRATGGEGSHGLGLAITRSIVEGHQGRIWVESEVGRGSTFRVALPILGPSLS